MRKYFSVALTVVVMGLLLSGCASHKQAPVAKVAKLDPFAGQGSPYYPGKGPIPMGGGRYHVGKPYQVAGRWFTPKEQPGYDKVGLSSWYGEAFHRRKTSNGEWFDMAQMTAAHATLPLPSYAKVTNLANGNSVVVRINDRGPFVDTRVLDVSKRAAEELGYKDKGVAKVRVQYIGPAPLNDNGRHLAAMNRELHDGTSLQQLTAAADASTTRRPTTVALNTAKKKNAAPQDMANASLPVQQVAYQADTSNSSAGMRYYVAAGSFADQNNAERLRQSLSATGPVQVMEMSGQGGSIYRVQVGPFADANTAHQALRKTQSQGFADARIIKTLQQQASLR